MNIGESVKKGQVIAKANSPLEQIWSLVNEWGIDLKDVSKYFLIDDGIIVPKGTMLAKYIDKNYVWSFWNLFSS